MPDRRTARTPRKTTTDTAEAPAEAVTEAVATPDNTTESVAVEATPEAQEPTVNTVTETLTTPVDDKTGRKTVNADVAFEELGEVAPTENPFARGARGNYAVPESNPVYQLFMRSLDAGKAWRTRTDDAYSLVRQLRKVASQREQGVKFDKRTLAASNGNPPADWDGIVTFQAMPERSTKGRKKVAAEKDAAKNA